MTYDLFVPIDQTPWELEERKIHIHLPLSFEGQQILLVGGEIVGLHGSCGAGPQRELFVEERDADVETVSQLEHSHAGLGQNGLTRIETQWVLRVIRPSARVQIEDDVVPAIVPIGQSCQSGWHIPNIILG